MWPVSGRRPARRPASGVRDFAENHARRRLGGSRTPAESRPSKPCRLKRVFPNLRPGQLVVRRRTSWPARRSRCPRTAVKASTRRIDAARRRRWLQPADQLWPSLVARHSPDYRRFPGHQRRDVISVPRLRGRQPQHFRVDPMPIICAATVPCRSHRAAVERTPRRCGERLLLRMV